MMISPPAGPLPGNREASAASHSYWQRARKVNARLQAHFGRVRFWLSVTIISALMAGAIIKLGDGVRIIVKAHIAQILIHQAWQQNLLAGKANVKPWPWADMTPVARLTFEQQQTELFILDNDAPRTLAFGPGILPTSTLPGRGGNTVISAHRDTHFAALEHAMPGALIQVETIEGRRLSYEIRSRQIVNEHDVWVTDDRGHDELTLVTCWPFNALVPGGSDRLVVTAVLIGRY